MRWRHPQQGIVLPGAFVPVAEESGLIVPLGRWVMREACRQLARWTADPLIEFTCLTVNLSGRQLAEATLAEELHEILRQTGAPPDKLGLELTESVLMEETSSPTAVLQDLKALGVRLLLDDFGTGYSSLNHVKRFPIEAIKVDREFCSGVVEEEGDRHILRAIVSMASAMDVAVVAEGVESPEQARWLRHLGIGLVQGYAFGRPAPAAAAETLMREGLPLDRLALAFEPLTDEPMIVPAAPRGLSAPEAAAAGGATVTLGEAAEALGRLELDRPPLGRHRPHPGRAHERRPPALPGLRAAPAGRRGRRQHPPRGAPDAAARRHAAHPPRAARRRRRRAERGGRARPLRRPGAGLVRLGRGARAARAPGRRRSPPRAAPAPTTARSRRPAASSPTPTSPAPACSSATASSSASATRRRG